MVFCQTVQHEPILLTIKSSSNPPSSYAASQQLQCEQKTAKCKKEAKTAAVLWRLSPVSQWVACVLARCRFIFGFSGNRLPRLQPALAQDCGHAYPQHPSQEFYSWVWEWTVKILSSWPHMNRGSSMDSAWLLDWRKPVTLAFKFALLGVHGLGSRLVSKKAAHPPSSQTRTN